MKRKGQMLACFLALGLLGSGPLLASDSLDDAARDVARETGGKVLSARTLNLREGRTHEIKVLTREGRVRTLRIPEHSSRDHQQREHRRYPEQYDRRERPRGLPDSLERNRAEDPNRYQDPRARQSYRQLFRDQNIQRAPRPADRRGQGRSQQERSDRGNSSRPDNHEPGRGQVPESRRGERNNGHPER